MQPMHALSVLCVLLVSAVLCLHGIAGEPVAKECLEPLLVQRCVASFSSLPACTSKPKWSNMTCCVDCLLVRSSGDDSASSSSCKALSELPACGQSSTTGSSSTTDSSALLPDSNGCPVCDYTRMKRTDDSLLMEEKCDQLTLSACALGTSPQVMMGCPTCRVAFLIKEACSGGGGGAPGGGGGGAHGPPAGGAGGGPKPGAGGAGGGTPNKPPAGGGDHGNTPPSGRGDNGGVPPVPRRPTEQGNCTFEALRNCIDVDKCPPGVRPLLDTTSCCSTCKPKSGGSGGGNTFPPPPNRPPNPPHGNTDSSNAGGNDNNGGAGDMTACTAQQKLNCQQKLSTLPTCDSGKKPVFDSTTCCINCRPDSKPYPAPSATWDHKTVQAGLGDLGIPVSDLLFLQSLTNGLPFGGTNSGFDFSNLLNGGGGGFNIPNIPGLNGGSTNGGSNNGGGFNIPNIPGLNGGSNNGGGFNIPNIPGLNGGSNNGGGLNIPNIPGLNGGSNNGGGFNIPNIPGLNGGSNNGGGLIPGLNGGSNNGGGFNIPNIPGLNGGSNNGAGGGLLPWLNGGSKGSSSNNAGGGGGGFNIPWLGGGGGGAGGGLFPWQHAQLQAAATANNKAGPNPTWKNCTEEMYKQCMLNTGTCDDDERPVFDFTMCCKHCKRREQLCTPSEVAGCVAASPECADGEKPYHMDGMCCMTCRPKAPACSPACGAGQVCVPFYGNATLQCRVAEPFTLTIAGGGASYQQLLQSLSPAQLHEYVVEVARRYCEVPQAYPACHQLLGPVERSAVSGLVLVNCSASQTALVILLPRAYAHNTSLTPHGLLRSPGHMLQAAFSGAVFVRGDTAAGAQKLSVSLVPGVGAQQSAAQEAASISIATVAAVVVVALLAGGGWFVYRRRKQQQAQAAHAESALSHMSTRTAGGTSSPAHTTGSARSPHGSSSTHSGSARTSSGSGRHSGGSSSSRHSDGSSKPAPARSSSSHHHHHHHQEKRQPEIALAVRA